jgi:hypothetical protein
MQGIKTELCKKMHDPIAKPASGNGCKPVPEAPHDGS